MGLDIYAGPLTRYYSHNWKTVVQQWAEENGYTFNRITPDGEPADNEEEMSPAEVQAAVENWRDQILSAISQPGQPPYAPWLEDNEKPYYTDKPDWDALDDLSDKGVIKKFPPCIASTHTALVLKEPKTKTSIRRVYLPKTVAYMLVERKKEIDELMDLFGDEYIDNNLVFCSSNGRPMESQVINRAFNKLIKENGLPHVVFHSLRHSSITYKLKLNGGDMKSVQGDSGHAQVKMVADVYSHIIDEDRCINAQRLEEAFYSSKTPDPVEDTEPKTADTAVTESDESDAAKILELLKNPETAALLKQLAKAL